MSRINIKSLYLEGFAKINTGMHIDRLFLDFENMPNQTYLFVGDSGSGKSSILKSIHPFAFNSSTGDESSNSDLIMSGRDGKKVIIYELDNQEIECKHLYLRKNDGSISVKSYFSLDGEELNPSGLVTTFKEIVSQYFFIDESFLTILALGNSVRSLVDYTSGERKKSSVRIFTELNIYMKYYKNASAVVKDLKTILNNVVDKLGKYGEYDKKEIIKSIKELEAITNNLELEISNILQKQGSLITKIETNKKDYDEYKDSRTKITTLLEEVESIKRRRKTTKDYKVLENDTLGIKSSVIDTELRIKSLTDTINSELTFKESKINTRNQLSDSINRMKNNINQIELEKLLANIDAELSTLVDIDIDNNIDYKEKKEQLVRANIYLDELRSMCSDLSSEITLKELIPDVLKRFLSNKNFESQLDTTYQTVIEKITNLKSANQINGEVKVPVIKNTSCEEITCPYRKFYEDVYSLLNAKKDKAKSILKDEEDKLFMIEETMSIRRILKKLYDYINSHSDVLKFVPIEIFDPATFIMKFMEDENRYVYNRDLMTSTVSYMESATRKSELLSLKETTKSQIDGINNTKNIYESMKIDLEQTILSIKEADNVIETYQRDLEYNKNKFNELNKSFKELNIEMSLAKELEDKRNEIQMIQKNLTSMENLAKEYDKLSNELSNYKLEESLKQEELKEKRILLNKVRNTLESIESLEKEKVELASRYSEAVMIKDAVSPSKGIPVEFIDDVIRNQMIDSINELMHIAYPDITLLKDREHLIINDKEFTIPYKKNGIIIGDISEASDGERAMLSLAFSLVLIRLVSKVYNIMLLDEMDTALDKYGRSKYIDIIEQYMKTIDASQIFLISHNSMFDMYDINVLYTTVNNSTVGSEGTLSIPVYEQNFTPDFLKE